MSDYTPPTLVIPTPGGNPGDGSLSGALTVLKGENPTSLTPVINVSKSILPFMKYDGSSYVFFDKLGNEIFYLSNSTITFLLNTNFQGTMYYNSTRTTGTGIPFIFGKDKRTGLTAADASATTLYTTTAAGQLYRLMGRILATAGTSPSATYTIKWTEGGVVITKTLTISALDSDSDLSILIQPDNATAITAQLTAISGTGTTVNVAATVEQMA